MSEHVKLKRQKLLLLALKTAIGGSAAIYIAEKIGLQFAFGRDYCHAFARIDKMGDIKTVPPQSPYFFDVSCTLLGNFSLDVWQMD